MLSNLSKNLRWYFSFGLKERSRKSTDPAQQGTDVCERALSLPVGSAFSALCDLLLFTSFLGCGRAALGRLRGQINWYMWTSSCFDKFPSSGPLILQYLMWFLKVFNFSDNQLNDALTDYPIASLRNRSLSRKEISLVSAKNNAISKAFSNVLFQNKSWHGVSQEQDAGFPAKTQEFSLLDPQFSKISITEISYYLPKWYAQCLRLLTHPDYSLLLY